MTSFFDMLTVRVRITDNTEETDLDQYFTNAWSHRQPVVLVLDTTQCSRITLNKALTIRRVLNKHRANARKFIDHSEILVKSELTNNILKTALCIIRTERPVKILIPRINIPRYFFMNCPPVIQRTKTKYKCPLVPLKIPPYSTCHRMT